MNSFNIIDFIGGWIIGDFQPSIVKTKDYQIAVKRYKKSDSERPHIHNQCQEITYIIDGLINFNGTEFSGGQGIILQCGQPMTEFIALEDSTTLVIKTPSIPSDKHYL